ncbi:hypothetical protein [Virgibacillus sp. SK37]|uniref:hypothetical protein n=1 Tax=Virgibacillus sp. SK37 TaxID=403957 RepID=UPI0004D16228|nr:hypothetical protein [Virgibacillus sp. SK37]AIF42085.1 hypothetical protein X953_00895 [Virgibacillus sp. SK37]
MSNDEKIEKDTYLAIGTGTGISLGVVLGLTVLDDLAIGVGAGLSIGVSIGMLIDSNKNKEE